VRWQPISDPNPGPEVRVVARYGDDPRDLRAVRTRTGWVRCGTEVEASGDPVPWKRVGRCSAGRSHWVVPVRARTR
jgi:hypothetical protein